MLDREKVIRGLECCVRYDDEYQRACVKCPYRGPYPFTCMTLHTMLKDALEALKEKTAGGWISVKDRMPEEDKKVLVARKFIWPGHKVIRYVEIAERIGSDWTSDSDEYKIYRPYHTDPYAWMPLQEPPEVNENG